MIIVTGPGRSGTSLVAAVYRELGLDPGGTWYPEIRAGFEDPEVIEVNKRIIRDLGLSPLDPRPVPKPVHQLGNRLFGLALKRRLRKVLYRQRLYSAHRIG